MKYLKFIILSMCCVLLASCKSTPGGVIEKVKYDFGLGEKPAGYVSGLDRVMQNLPRVGEMEIKRMNFEARQGEIKFQQGKGLQGKYYKEVKVYEKCYPLDAQAISKGENGERGYLGYIEYEYTIYQSERKATRAEAAASSATIPTMKKGRDVYRYHFSAGGNWDRGNGELTRR